MKNLKKVLALVLSLAMIISTFTVSFAAEKTDAQVCEALEMLKGDGNGVTDEYLAKSTTRFQAALMVLRLQNLEEEAMAFEGTDTFADAEDLTWVAGRAVLAYLKANPELGWLGDGTNFNPNGPITAQAYYKVMLEAIGYKQGTDFEWTNVLEFAAEKGLKAAADVENFTNNEIAVVTVETLKAENSEGVKLIDALVEAGAIDEAVAVEAGLVEPTPEELAVVSVTATNLKQLVVEYNQAIDEAGDEGNYELTTDGTAELDEDSDFALSEDGMTVTITLTTAAEQQDVVDLTIKDILDEDTTIEDVECFDKIPPEALTAEVVGKDTIKVTFSEPVMADKGSDELQTANFEVNDGHKLYVKSVKLQNNNTEALVELYSSLEEGTVTLTVKKDTEDFAKFGVIKAEFEVPVTEDEDAPVVIGYKDATPKEVTLIWSEDIEIAKTGIENYYHTNSKNEIDASGVTVDGAEMTLKFNENELPQGTAYVYVLKEAVNDLWDNENAQEMIKVEVDLDVTAPEVDGDVDVVSEESVTINFTEDVDADDTAIDDENYTLLDSDGEELDIITGISMNGTDAVDVAFSESLSGDYTLVIEDVEDLAGNKIADTSLPFNVDDLTAPDFTDFKVTVYNAGDQDQMIVIDFEDVMATEGEYSIIDSEKYEFVLTDDTEVTLDSLDEDLVSFNVINDGKSVEITVPSLDDIDAADSDDDGVDFGDTDADPVTLLLASIKMGKVADAAGNTTAGVTGTITVVSLEGTIENPDVEATAKDTIVMTFKEDVEKLEVTDFEVQDSLGNKLDVASLGRSEDSDGNTVVTFTLVDDLTATALSTTRAVVVTAVETDSENSYGEKIKSFTETVIDKIAPAVDKVIFVNSSKIQVVFDEDLAAGFFSGSGMNGFNVSDADSVSLDGSDAKIVNITSNGDFTDNTNVSYNDKGDLEDVHGNAMESFTHTDKLD